MELYNAKLEGGVAVFLLRVGNSTVGMTNADKLAIRKGQRMDRGIDGQTER